LTPGHGQRQSARMQSKLWRLFFILCAVLLMLGGPQHPGGNMAQMLGSSAWVPAHALMLAGFVSLLAGLVLYRKNSLPARTSRWARMAIYGTALQAIEMAVHLAAKIDHQNLMAGRATPVFTTHLALAVVAYPVFAATMVGLILAGARDQALGTKLIAWLGIAGAIAHGASTPLVVVFKVRQARVLFPFLLLLALWLILAAVWPIDEGVRQNSGTAVAS
jgi:hypothetical protein